MNILTFPNEELRKVSSDVTVFDDLLKSLVSKLIDRMYSDDGVGIASPQIGVHRRVVIVDPSAGQDAKQMLVMVNPKILTMHGKALSVEGCLSIPGVRGEVERSAEVEVEFQTTTGEKQLLKAGGFLSVIIQHEVDHLDGVLFVDKIKETRKLTLRKTG